MKSCLGILLIFVLLLPIIILLPALGLWFSWTYMEIGTTYFSFLPVQFHSVPFWDCFLLIMAFGTIGSVVTGSYGKAMQSVNKKD
jgi:hypothetical protein